MRGNGRVNSIPAASAHVRTVSFKRAADCLVIDPITLKHLEVMTGSEGGPQGSLLNEIDRTVTSMGGRMLRAWLLRPLVALERIRDRLDSVEELAFRSTDRGKFREVLKTVHDMERLVARAASRTAKPATRAAAVPVPPTADAYVTTSPLRAPPIAWLVPRTSDSTDSLMRSSSDTSARFGY